MARITDENVKKWLDHFLKALNTTYSPEKVLIFGSRARGDHLLDSDIDLIIVSRKFEGINWLERIREVSDLWEGLVLPNPYVTRPRNLKKRKSRSA